MIITTRCDDKYEAQKLAGLIFVEDQRNDAGIKQILNIVENEMIIAVKDESAHSILLKDSREVERFADFVQSVLEKEHEITAAAASGERVTITKQVRLVTDQALDSESPEL